MFELTSGLLRRLKQMKSMKKNDMGVSPVIAVILMVAITVVLAGVLYLWVSSLADTDKETDLLDMKIEAFADATVANDYDKIEVTVNSGTVNWAEYKLTVDGEQWYTASASSSAGDIAVFYDTDGVIPAVATDADPGFAQSDDLVVKIVNLGTNSVSYQDLSVIALGYASS